MSYHLKVEYEILRTRAKVLLDILATQFERVDLAGDNWRLDPMQVAIKRLQDQVDKEGPFDK